MHANCCFIQIWLGDFCEAKPSEVDCTVELAGRSTGVSLTVGGTACASGMDFVPAIWDHLTPRQRAQVENAQMPPHTRFGEDPKVCRSNNLFAGPARSGGVSSSL